MREDTLPVLVMLPGHLCTARLWEDVIPSLSPLARCLPLSLDNGSSMHELAEDVLQRSPDTFSLLGFSMGGHVAMEIMRRAPERVQRLALLGTRADVDTEDRMRSREADLDRVRQHGVEALIPELPARWMNAAHAEDPGLRAVLAGMVRDVGETVQRAQQKALMTRADSRPSLSAIACPTLFLCGRDDLPNPVATQMEMHRLVVGSRMQVIEDSGHLVPIEQPHALGRALAEWLR
jgi:pimeloyl-ACP methyl ester carboxylesterase